MHVTKDLATLTDKATPVTGSLHFAVPGGQSRTFRLDVDRTAMAVQNASALLKLSTPSGAVTWVPVSASK